MIFQMKPMTIGAIAKKSGISRVTLRYYERIGLIPKSSRSSSGYRLYSPTIISRIHFIQKAKHLGFSLEEIIQLLALHDTDANSSMPVRKNVQAKLKEVEEKIDDLKRIQKALQYLLSTCTGELAVSKCPIMQNIFSDSQK